MVAAPGGACKEVGRGGGGFATLIIFPPAKLLSLGRPCGTLRLPSCGLPSAPLPRWRLHASSAAELSAAAWVHLARPTKRATWRGGQRPSALPSCVRLRRDWHPRPCPTLPVPYSAGWGEPGLRAGRKRACSPILAVGGALATAGSVPGRRVPPCRGWARPAVPLLPPRWSRSPLLSPSALAVGVVLVGHRDVPPHTPSSRCLVLHPAAPSACVPLTGRGHRYGPCRRCRDGGGSERRGANCGGAPAPGRCRRRREPRGRARASRNEWRYRTWGRRVASRERARGTINIRLHPGVFVGL